ncbi:hypothetical protein SASPL_154634 [Salvia splendens]|uniref:Programmed cell death protein 2 C-terminal domain-containing protein n=1 Tax=Salvia splendens TaxID=180675 RepID=A0A8X8YZF9_SALSN|nr:hypothetical protein SASPL_154634 [Salvia splendens]
MFQQCYVIGVGHGKETKFVVAVEECAIVLGITRLLTGDPVAQVIESYANSWSHLAMTASNSLWPEYEITCEDESEFDEPISSDNGSGNALVSRSRTEGSDGNLMNYFQASDDNSSWASFQERISSAPEQVLRYSSSSQANPLWPVSSGRPSRADIPRCNHCGGTRAFEFQVLPQILYFFHVEDNRDSLDWATIAVYTCEASCEGGASYKEEFAWVQLASQSISHQ